MEETGPVVSEKQEFQCRQESKTKALFRKIGHSKLSRKVENKGFFYSNPPFKTESFRLRP